MRKYFENRGTSFRKVRPGRRKSAVNPACAIYSIANFVPASSVFHFSPFFFRFFCSSSRFSNKTPPQLLQVACSLVEVTKLYRMHPILVYFRLRVPSFVEERVSRSRSQDGILSRPRLPEVPVRCPWARRVRPLSAACTRRRYESVRTPW